jgi:2-polyprenyl-3-methyl-5-hydroxy-6-metoxy-1,4-benzoquinol methylase
MDVHVLTSHMEANPVSILEAMACGKPIVAPAVGSIPETVLDEATGLLAAPGDEQEFVEHIVHLLHSPLVARAMGRAGRERVVEHFSLERMVEGYEKLIEGVYTAKCQRQAAKENRFRLGGKLGFWLLRALSKRPSAATAPQEPTARDANLDSPGNELTAEQGAARLEQFLGRDVWSQLTGKRVLDFGCGAGAEAVAAALHGAEMVYGVDIQEPRLAAARRLADAHGMSDRCRFLHPLTDQQELAELQGTIDAAWSIDSFEHYDQPLAILNQIQRLLAPGGRLLVSFGPPWKNPYGCHMWFFNRCPWIHLLFREETILAVRRLYRNDGAKRYREVDGGLNQMTLARFTNLVEQSGMHLELLRPVPLSSRLVNCRSWWQPLFNNPLLREYTTSVVLCRLRRPVTEPAPHGEPSPSVVAV